MMDQSDNLNYCLDRDTVNSAVKHLYYRAPIIFKKVSGEVDKVLQWRISQIIKEGGAE